MNALTRLWHSFARIEKAILIVCGSALLFFGGGFYGRSRNVQSLPPLFVDAPAAKAISIKTSGAPMTIHVAGEVKKPGVLALPAGARIHDAIRKAGGATKNADLNALNLAQKLKDGEQVLVRRRGQVFAATGGERASTLAAGGRTRARASTIPPHPLNINTANAVELETLPGIGPALAARIVERRAKDRFDSLDELDEVNGIGPKKLADLKPYVRF